MLQNLLNACTFFFFQKIIFHIFANADSLLQPITIPPMLYPVGTKFDIFNILAQSIYRGLTLEPPRLVVLTSTHNLCFGAKIRKKGIPLHTPVLLHKSGVYGVYITWLCYPDVTHWECKAFHHFIISYKELGFVFWADTFTPHCTVKNPGSSGRILT